MNIYIHTCVSPVMLAQFPFHAHACTDPEAVPLLVNARVSPSYTKPVPCQPLLSGACWI